MPGILQFALGLNPGNFLGNVTRAAGALGGLIGVGVSVGAVISKIGQEINRGAHLEDLKNRTGVAVESLNGLQRGFQAVGIEGDGFLAVVAGLQRSLGGFNEMGEPTKDIFAGIGLSVDDLKKKDLPGAMEEIFGKLAGLDANTATNFAAKIFGRGAGGDSLQAARNMEEFSGAVQRARRESELLGKHSGSFNALGNSAGEFRRQLDSAALGIAAGLTPSLRAITDTLNAIDVEGIGHRLGGVMLGLGEAVRQGQLGEVIELSIQAGVHGGITFLLAEIKQIPAALGSAVKEGLTGAGPGAKRIRSLALSAAGALDPTGALNAIGGASALTNLAVKPGLDALAGRTNEAKKKLDALIDKLKGNAEERIKNEQGKPAAPAAPANKATPDEKVKPPGSALPNDADALTRIGFFSGGGSGGGQALEAIKETSRQTVEQLRNLNAFIARKPHLFDDGGFANL